MEKEKDIEKAINDLIELQQRVNDVRINIAIAYLRSQQNSIRYLKGRVKNLLKSKTKHGTNF